MQTFCAKVNQQERLTVIFYWKRALTSAACGVVEMQISTIKTFSGPSVYHNQPLLRVRLDIGELERVDSSEMPEFIERLLQTLPSLWHHRCSKGYPGGFVERLRIGTWMAHIVEHMALALSDLASISVGYGKTVMTDTPGVYDVYLRFQNESGMRELVHVSVDLAEALLANREFPLEARLEKVREIVKDTAYGPSTAAIVRAAELRGIPVRRLNDDSLVQLGYGCKQKRIEAAVSSGTSHLGVSIAGQKQLTKDLLQQAAIPAPEGEIVRDARGAVQAAQRLGYPVAIKPLDGNHGRGVSVNVQSEEEAVQAFEVAKEHSSSVIVEQMFEGRDYRILVVNGELVAASERIPAHVIGDGIRTVAELIELENDSPLRGDGHEKPLTRICPVKAACSLAHRGLSLDHVPKMGTFVSLCGTANLSTGGTARDVTDEVHESVRIVCERAARIIGLDIAGIDLMTPDIATPLPERAGIIEVNAGPGLRMHHHPNEGLPRDVGAAVVEMLYPTPETGRIPTVAITGTNGKTTVARMIERVFSHRFGNVGLTTTEGIWIGGKQVASGDTTGPWSARLVLSEPTVDAAVLETARGGIVRSGLGYDWTDVGILTNIQADHIGQDGIHDLEDILRIKSVVAERVREGGTLILNADDPLLASLTERDSMQRTPSKQIVYFSLSDRNSRVQKHLAAGGTAYTMADGHLLESVGNRTSSVARVDRFAITMSGTARFQIANLLAAIAGCRAFGIELDLILAALTDFGGAQQNRGRVNLYQVNGAYVLVDYGHNIGAFQAICDMTRAWNRSETIGVVSLPGDRSDDLLREAARVAGCGFQRLIIREDNDKRGRKAGAVAEQFHNVIRMQNPGIEPTVILDEGEAYRSALQLASPGKVIVLFYDDYKLVEAALQEAGAAPADFTAEPVRELQMQTALRGAAS